MIDTPAGLQVVRRLAEVSEHVTGIFSILCRCGQTSMVPVGFCLDPDGLRLNGDTRNQTSA